VAEAAHHIAQREVKSAWQTFGSARWGKASNRRNRTSLFGKKRSLRTPHESPQSQALCYFAMKFIENA